MKDFIEKHRKLMVFLCIISVLLLIATVSISIIRTGIFSGPVVNKDTQLSDNDVGYPIQYISPLYSLSADSEKSEELTITAYSGYRNAAVNIIYEFGLSPTDFKINFTYESPFKRYE